MHIIVTICILQATAACHNGDEPEDIESSGLPEFITLSLAQAQEQGMFCISESDKEAMRAPILPIQSLNVDMKDKTRQEIDLNGPAIMEYPKASDSTPYICTPNIVYCAVTRESGGDVDDRYWIFPPIHTLAAT